MNKAIVNSGSRKVIGEVEDVTSVSYTDVGTHSSTRRAQPGDVVTVKNAWELRCDMFLLPTSQGPIAMHKNSCVPIDAEEEETDVIVKIDNIRWFDDMKDRGKKYDAMIDEIKDVMIQTRANRAGIETAKQMPKQQDNGSGIIL